MQIYFLAEGAADVKSRRARRRANINRIIALIRQIQAPVYEIRHSNAPSCPQALPALKREMPFVAMGFASLMPGASGHHIDLSLDRHPGEPVINKFRYSCFIHHASDLHDRLQAAGIDTIVIVGPITNGCCESTARDASMIGYKLLAVTDAMAAMTDEEQAASFLGMCIGFADVVTTEEIINRVKRNPSFHS